MKKRIELKRVRKLVKKGYIMILDDTRIITLVKGTKSYFPKVEMEVR